MAAARRALGVGCRSAHRRAACSRRWSSSLVDCLQSEIDEENQAADVPPNLATLLSQSTYKLMDDSAEEPFMVEFGAEAFPGVEVFMDIRDLSMTPEEDEETEASKEIPLVVTLAGANGQQLKFGCVASQIDDEGVLSIDRIEIDHVDDENDEDEEGYSPEFHELDMDLQDEFLNYLSEREIGDGLAALALEVAEFKEHAFYRDWLEKTHQFVIASSAAEK